MSSDEKNDDNKSKDVVEDIISCEWYDDDDDDDDDDDEGDDDGDNLEAVALVMGVSARSGHRHNGDHLKLNSEPDDDDDEHEGSSGVWYNDYRAAERHNVGGAVYSDWWYSDGS